MGRECWMAVADPAKGRADLPAEVRTFRVAEIKRVGRYRIAAARPAAPKLSRARRRPREVKPAETLSEQAYRVIEEQITTLRLKPGEVLSEQLLSASYGFGRTPTPEALQRLAGEGLVTALWRKGMLVSVLNPRTRFLVLESRAR